MINQYLLPDAGGCLGAIPLMTSSKSLHALPSFRCTTKNVLRDSCLLQFDHPVVSSVFVAFKHEILVFISQFHHEIATAITVSAALSYKS